MYFPGLKRRQTFEECIYDLQNFDKHIKYPKRNATKNKKWLDSVIPRTFEVKYYMDENLKKVLLDKIVQTDIIKLEHKATQTNLNEKSVQVDVNP